MTDTSTLTDVAGLVADLTLEEKASLTSGASFWTTKPVERVGIPADHAHRRPARPAQAGARAATTSASATASRPRASRPPSRSARPGTPSSPSASAPPSASSRRSRTSRSPRPGHQHQALAAVRAQLRVPLRGPDRLGRARRGARARHPVAGRRRVAQALRGEQPGERPHAVLERHRPAAAARDLPARLPARRRGRPAADGDVLVQPRQRRLRVGEPVAAHPGAARRVGLRRPRRLGLGRGQRPRRRPRGRPRPRDARQRRSDGRRARRRGARRRRSTRSTLDAAAERVATLALRWADGASASRDRSTSTPTTRSPARRPAARSCC